MSNINRKKKQKLMVINRRNKKKQKLDYVFPSKSTSEFKQTYHISFVYQPNRWISVMLETIIMFVKGSVREK